MPDSSSFGGPPELMPLSRLVSWVGNALARDVGRTAGEYGLTMTAMGVLAVLSCTDRLSHRELAGRLGVSPATLTPVVDTLEAAGELVRERDSGDRRIVRLSVTSAGREHLATASAQVALTMRARMPRPTPEHAEIIRDYLLAVLAAVGEKGGSSG